MEIPQTPREDNVEVVRHLTCFAQLCYSLYAGDIDGGSLVPEMMDALLDFRRFMEGLAD